MVFGGATLAEPMQEGQGMKSNGSAMLVCAETREEAVRVVEGDVYTKSGVWDVSKVCVCGWIQRREGFEGEDGLTGVQMQVFPFKSAVRKAL